MVEQNRSGAYTQIVYAPTGRKFALMNGQTLQKALVPLPGGGLAAYNSSGLLYYGHPDYLGSIRFASTPSRAMYFDLAHAPFGEVYANSGSTDPAFTGQRQDTVSGLYDFPAREYSNQGHWTSPDPAGLAAVDPAFPQSWNRYAYVRNNAMTLTDPAGLAPQCRNSCPRMRPGPSGCLSGCIFGGFSWYPDEYVEGGYDIFDAIEGAAGTYVSYDIYGRMSFGFSEELWSQTMNFIDNVRSNGISAPFAAPTDPMVSVPGVADLVSSTLPFSGFQVVIQDLGADTVVTGFIPELLSAQANIGSSFRPSFIEYAMAEQLGMDPSDAWKLVDRDDPGAYTAWQYYQEALRQLQSVALSYLPGILGH